MLAKTLGPRWRGWSNGVVSLYAFGTAVSFMIIMVEELHRIAAFFQHTMVGEHAAAVPWEENKRLLLVAVTATVVYPLSLLRDLSMLKLTSTFGALSAVYITAVVWVHAPWGARAGVLSLDVCHGGRAPVPSSSRASGSDGVGVAEGGGGGASRPRLWPPSVTSISGAIPLLSFALNSGWAFVPIFSTMRDPTPARGTRLIGWAHALILVNYLAMAAVGYLSFCDGGGDA